VQILVAVANTQPDWLSAEVQKASAATWIVHGSHPPKASSEESGKRIGPPRPSLRCRKGNSRTLPSRLEAERWSLTLPTALLGASGICSHPVDLPVRKISDPGNPHGGCRVGSVQSSNGMD
jgi:hypothetical protein